MIRVTLLYLLYYNNIIITVSIDQFKVSVTSKIACLEINKVVELDDSHISSSYGGVYVCISIPSLVLGSVGGGTSLATQKECLDLMGCYGKVCVLTNTC